MGTPVPGEGEGSLAKLGHLNVCKNFWAQHFLGVEIHVWASETVDLGGYDLASRSPKLLIQSLPIFFFFAKR